MKNVVSQNDFRGGMSAVFDSTKTPNNMFRCGLNTSIRKNSISGFFTPRRVLSPNAIHQAIFAFDAELIVCVAGKVYRFNDADGVIIPITPNSVLSETADVVYHEIIPAPTKMIVNGRYETNISTFVPAAVLQDGESQPSLVDPALGVREAGTYDSWTYETPEYIPIGKQMAYSGNRLYIASPDGRKIYQSVSGRCHDFVLNFNSTTGEKQGNADTTATAVSAAALTALKPSQNGGFLGATRYGSHFGQPRPDYPLFFGEVYIDPVDIFPVGAINQQSFTFANGESVFVSPSGIQAFNQVAQIQTESNATLFGAPISDFLIKPITRTATATAAEYTFFAFPTIYGDAILVFDNRLSAWSGMITGYAVKEFAVLNKTGQERLFFITTANEMYELPLFSGTRAPYTVYFGELAADADASVKSRRVSVMLNNIRSSGNLQVAFYHNRKQIAVMTQRVTSDRATDNNFATIPVDFPTEGETQASSYYFEPVISEHAQSLGLRISVEAEADIVSVALETEIHQRETKQIELVTSDDYTFLGNITEDNVYTANAQSVVVGQSYLFYTPAGDGQLLNGKDVVNTYAAHDCVAFIATANKVYFTTGQVIDFNSTRTLLENSIRPVILGKLGSSTRCSPFLRLIDQLGKTPSYVLGSHEHDDNNRLIYAYGHTGITNFYKHETDNVRIFLLTFPITTAMGVGPYVSPDEIITASGSWAMQIERINAANPTKPCVVCFHQSPHTADGGYVDLRWPFKRLGVHAVITGDGSYYRTYQNSTVFARIGGKDGVLNLKAHTHGLDFTYETLAGVVNDRFFVSR